MQRYSLDLRQKIDDDYNKGDIRVDIDRCLQESHPKARS